MTDTIFALASGAPPSAIAVMRISGPDADRALLSLTDQRLPEYRRAVVRELETGSVKLDHALVIRFPAPASATGEDVVELYLHGGRATIAAVRDALGAINGFRPAEAGEFTRRAFQNGRMDLAEVEGLADLLRAETEAQRRAAYAVASGGLTARVDALRREVLMATARVEAVIDFDDEDDVVPWAERYGVLTGLATTIRSWLAFPAAERLHDGLRVVVGGPPNAGKSTLINALTNRNASIISDIAGTTRDIIEVPVQLCGVAFVFIDTAGLRATPGDSIERIGIARAVDAIDHSDILIWLGDAADAPDHAACICVQSKADLANGSDDGRPRVSAVTGEGMQSLVKQIVDQATLLVPPADEVALNRRQQACLETVATECEHAAHVDDMLIVAEHLRAARVSFDRLTGRACVEAMLDNLFGSFCIGK